MAARVADGRGRSEALYLRAGVAETVAALLDSVAVVVILDGGKVATPGVGGANVLKSPVAHWCSPLYWAGIVYCMSRGYRR